MMKTIARQMVNTLLISLLLAIPDVKAQTPNPDLADSLIKKSSFAISTFMDAHRRINLMVATYRPNRVSIILKNAKNATLYREHLRKANTSYRRRFDFEGIESGVYQLEISDGQQTVVRRVEVVDMSAIEAQRYVVYGPQISQ